MTSLSRKKKHSVRLPLWIKVNVPKWNGNLVMSQYTCDKYILFISSRWLKFSLSLSDLDSIEEEFIFSLVWSWMLFLWQEPRNKATWKWPQRWLEWGVLEVSAGSQGSGPGLRSQGWQLRKTFSNSFLIGRRKYCESIGLAFVWWF